MLKAPWTISQVMGSCGGPLSSYSLYLILEPPWAVFEVIANCGGIGSTKGSSLRFDQMV